QDEGAVAYDDAGGFLVVWTSGPAFTSSACRFDSTGARVGAEFQIANFSATSAQHLPAGGFVVVGDHLSPRDVRARLLDEQGRPLGAEFRVDPSTGVQSLGQVAPVADGFVVAWHNLPAPGQPTEVDARLYDAAIQPRGAAFRVSEPNANHEDNARVGSVDDGFVVTWTDEGYLEWNARARRFDASGAP